MTSPADTQLVAWKERMSALGRLPKEWVGKTPAAMPPPTVRDRILRAHKSICHISGIEIRPGMLWHADHIIPLADGGLNAERNLACAIDQAHREKTAQENSERAKLAAKRRAAMGNKAAQAKPIQSAPFPSPVKKHRASAPIEKLAALPRRAIFE